MANTGGCDTRNQMEIRRQRMNMYENRYNRSQMMLANQNSCTTCGTARNMTECDSCSSTRMENSCEECGNSNQDKLRGMAVAMGYVPWQNFECTYDTMEGFRAGTIFPELDKPFYGRRGMR